MTAGSLVAYVADGPLDEAKASWRRVEQTPASARNVALVQGDGTEIYALSALLLCCNSGQCWPAVQCKLCCQVWGRRRTEQSHDGIACIASVKCHSAQAGFVILASRWLVHGRQAQAGQLPPCC